jgi:hypothetical protein
MKPTVAFIILQTGLKKVKLYFLMEPTEKLATKKNYHLTGNALKLNTESSPNSVMIETITLSSPKICVLFFVKPLGILHPIYRTGIPLLSRERFYTFVQQIYFIIFFETCYRISVYSTTICRTFHNVTFFGSQNIHILHKWCAKILPY